MADEHRTPLGEERRSEVIMAFLGAGLHQPPSRALAVFAWPKHAAWSLRCCRAVNPSVNGQVGVPAGGQV